MREVGSAEAEGSFGSLLDLVEGGEEVVITRRGKPVARLVREPDSFDRAAARRAADDLIAMSKGASLGGLKIKDLIEEGRP
jgi:prevent-host-death family protein